MSKNTFGICNNNGEYFEISKTEKGAKNYATRNGYKIIYMRFNLSLNIAPFAYKKNNKWLLY
jgi:hypothetical protein